jgi:hypothetical protein
MSVKAPEALEQYINRAEVGDEQIRINIKRLLQRLCTDQNGTTRWSAQSHCSFNGSIQSLAILAREATMVQRASPRNAEEERVLSRPFSLECSLDRHGA